MDACVSLTSDSFIALQTKPGLATAHFLATIAQL
jgi:hypothetical protein